MFRRYFSCRTVSCFCPVFNVLWQRFQFLLFHVNASSHAGPISELPVHFTKELEDVTVPENETIKLICETSKPNVPVKWYKNGEEIVSGLHYKINGTGTQCILTVLDATEKDTNTYTCKIVSSEETTKGKLTVEGRLRCAVDVARFVGAWAFICAFL